MSSHPLVVVGSANAIKIEAVHAAATALLGAGVRVEGIAVSSEAPDQPWGDAETLAGAATRAVTALANWEGATIGVGIEAGLIDRPDHCVESVSWVVAVGMVGGRRVRGQSRAASYLLPDELARRARGSTLGEATRLMFPGVPRSHGTVGPLTGGRVDRIDHYREAALLALIPFNPDNSDLTFPLSS